MPVEMVTLIPDADLVIRRDLGLSESRVYAEVIQSARTTTESASFAVTFSNATNAGRQLITAWFLLVGFRNEVTWTLENEDYIGVFVGPLAVRPQGPRFDVSVTYRARLVE